MAGYRRICVDFIQSKRALYHHQNSSLILWTSNVEIIDFMVAEQVDESTTQSVKHGPHV
jgi:hypothetical protein